MLTIAAYITTQKTTKMPSTALTTAPRTPLQHEENLLCLVTAAVWGTYGQKHVPLQPPPHPQIHSKGRSTEDKQGKYTAVFFRLGLFL